MEHALPAAMQPGDGPVPMQVQDPEPPANPPRQMPEKPAVKKPAAKPVVKKPVAKKRPTRDVGTNTMLIQTPHRVKFHVLQYGKCYLLVLRGNAKS